MCKVIAEQTRIAHKAYEDMASVWLTNSDVQASELTFAERRAVVRARRDGWNIKPGQRYLDQSFKQDGEVMRIRYRPDIHRICIRLDLYECT